MIGNLRSVVFDARDPRGLARFWAALLGGSIVKDDDDWVVVAEPSGSRLAFQLSPEHHPPQFPDPQGSQQIHLDIDVDDVDAAEEAVLALGGTKVADTPEGGDFRVFRDPAGHTFCLVFDVSE
ncbi:VOC family protein [Mycobacterium sp. 236(2023)]|uniref:VOC family protein n=1 Tax=Mycobacterium sp. 236(2023) TaxID=3038163 RepID=UPI0024157725|nr:VOC family protein [Mycobacterium sp. 236(2023)]MDG4665996.1 VOC family protein [Mycobacterium sp. 236(2023)]